MWNFLLGYSAGRAIGASPLRPFLKLALKLVAIGIIAAGLIYTYVVLKTVSERRHDPHVHSSSSH